MSKMFISPNKYIQGKNEILNLGKYINNFGKKAMLIGSEADIERSKVLIEKSIENAQAEIVYAVFEGVSSKEEFQKLSLQAKNENIDLIIGLGGGKSLDGAKAVGYFSQLPVIIIPTIASTDGPCSSIVALYKENGDFDSYLPLKNNPDLILVDTEIIVKAPVRFFKSGIGDAISTYFEGRAYVKNNPDKTLKISLAIAELCYKTLLEHSKSAIEAVKKGIVNESFENVVEANILLSCLGFENTGLSLAHAFHNHLNIFPETNKFMHGEKVALGVVVQLLSENSDEIILVKEFLKSMGLPYSLKDMEIDENDRENLMLLSKRLAEDKQVIETVPNINSNIIYNALIASKK